MTSNAVSRADTTLRATIPDRPNATQDGPNARLHWAARKKRSDYWRGAISAALYHAEFPRWLPNHGRDYRVTITVQQARGVIPDDDNRLGMLKTCRDHIARFLGVSDAPGGVEWRVEWVKGTTNAMIVELERTG